jgi:hypothetical protein
MRPVGFGLLCEPRGNLYCAGAFRNVSAGSPNVAASSGRRLLLSTSLVDGEVSPP